MNKSPKISIVIPSYNKVSFIEKTLDSIFLQKYDNLEVMIEDGGSNDGTVKIIRDFKSKYPNNIFWVSKKDGGQLDAINSGFKKATGDILTFINADDQYLPNTFRLISTEYLMNKKAMWFAGRGTVINPKEKEIAGFVTIYKNMLLKLNSYSLLLVTNYLIQPSVFLSKEAYIKYGPFTGTKDYVMEYDLWLKLGKKSMPRVIDATVSKFLIEPNTKTKTMYKSLLDEDIKIVKKYTKNPVILWLHKLHNVLRKIIAIFV